jgi:hypothetical protein
MVWWCALLAVHFVATLTQNASPSIAVVISEDIIAAVSAGVSTEIENTVHNTHPAPYVQRNDQATVTLSNFQFSVLLQGFGLANPGWQYFEEGAGFNYHVKQNGFPGISESGNIWIFTTNQNQKTLTVSVTTDFSGPTPTLHVNSATVGVESGDLYIVGECTDAICLIPVHDIIDPIAQKLIPTLQSTIVSQVQTQGNALFAKIADIIRIPLGPYTLEFNGEGALSVLPDGSLAYTANGGVLADVNGNFVPPPVPNNAPLPSLSTLPAGDFKVVISQWSLSAFVWALGKTGALDVAITPANLPSSFPLKLSTDSLFWDLAIPGLLKYPHLNLTISVVPIFTWPSVSILPSSDLSVGPLSFAFHLNIVNGAQVVLADAVVLNITLSLDLTTSVALQGSNATIKFDFGNHTDSVSVISSKVGTVATSTLGSIINLAFSFLKPPLFQVPLPSGVTVTGLRFVTSQGYAVLLVDGSVPVPPIPSSPAFRGDRSHKPGPSTKPDSAIFPSRKIYAAPAVTNDPIGTNATAVQVCGYGEGQNCPIDQTCCRGAKGGYFCCPTPHGTCCNDGAHCCPQGYGCVNNNQNCAPF